ncbi:hypothetical protein KY309_03130 [Candidatus Woesearchaeota archaeon]|nr:hypothetical protein [Candidatus Woesearchaeota archaeon]MBW3016580.1 hypothetical protein [Candidatus Woesearchaeota archaeon]
MDSTTELKEWVQIFLKSRDILEKSISGFEDLNGDFVVHKSSGDVFFFVRPELADVSGIVEKVSGSAGLVVLNTRKNVDFVVSNWGTLAKLPGLCIYFVNPAANEKWMLYPYTHNQITEKSALKRGLLSLFSTVPAV